MGEAMARLDSFYRTAEIQNGLIRKIPSSEQSAYALTMKGSFSWGITPSFEKSEKDKLKEKAKKKKEEELDRT